MTDKSTINHPVGVVTQRRAPRLIKPTEVEPLVRQILTKRGYKTEAAQADFLNPSYTGTKHDPFLLPDMDKAIARLKVARDQGEQVTIYGDYDVDGITATALLLDALPKFGFKVDSYTPDRFSEGYGLNKGAIDKLKQRGTNVILTVDNGIVSFDEVDHASELGIDVIVTDHHSPRDTLPEAVAVVDPKITAYCHHDCYDKHYLIHAPMRESQPGYYPFCDMCGCGVAFKLVQALQMVYPDALPAGQEKWLMDLVALGTVSDVVSLVDENRAFVKWGLQVIKKTRRPGIKALAAVAGLELNDIDSRAIGFVLGPRLNASGRLASAQLAIDLLMTKDNSKALELAQQLDDLNTRRKKLQTEIYEKAVDQVDLNEPVAIAVGDDWHEGVIGIVASKIEEKFEKPTFIFSRNGDDVKASGRSFGDFSVAAAITATRDLLVKGGGHVAAGGLTVRRDNFAKWKRAVNAYYCEQGLDRAAQAAMLYPDPDVEISDFSKLTPELVKNLSVLEPFGEANPVPVFELKRVIVSERRLMGADQNHVRYTFLDDSGNKFQAVAFSAADRFTTEPAELGDEPVRANVRVELALNEWNGNVSVQGKLIKMDKV